MNTLVTRIRFNYLFPKFTPHCRNLIDVVEDSGFQKVRVSILNKEENASLMIDSFSRIGFRLNNGLFALGSIVIFPRSVLSWKIKTSSEINEKSLTLFTILEPKIEILILGIGNNIDKASKDNLLNIIRKHKINVEILPTDQACTTFNFLNSESRYVAGALIPPAEISFTDQDYFQTKQRVKYLEADD